jgi:cysteine desulfurase / selenocysteine lyase
VEAATYLLTSDRFREVPQRLRQTLARLVGGDADDVVLANSASYGLHLIANGLHWRTGDEVLVMDSDFPSDILPWLRLESRGVSVRRERPTGCVFEVDEIRALIGPKTRLLCLTWVHSFSGWAIDLEAIGEVCRAQNILSIVNASQAIGARPVDVKTAPIDALISVGFK